MSDLFQPIASEQLIEWVFAELESRDSIFGIPRRHFFVPAKNDPFRTIAFGQLLETPFGPAAGPQQNVESDREWCMGTRDSLLAIAACLMWSTAFVTVKLILQYESPLTVAGIRQMADVQLEFNKGAEGRQTIAFIEGGGEMYVPTAEEMDSFRAVKEPMRDWYVEQFGQEWYDGFAGAAADCETSVDAKLAQWGSK